MENQEQLYDVRISVSKELSEHYNKIIERRDNILNDPNSADKDVIGILNTTTSIIRDLVKMQQDLYNSEKFAVLQQIIVNVLKESAPEVAEKVVKAFEERYEDLTA